MKLPFSTEDFLDVFRAYNLAVWPAQIALYLLAAILVFVALFGVKRWHRWSITVTLALLWT